VAPGILPWQQLNEIGAVIQRSIHASEALERYVLDLWDASQAPERFGVRLDGVDMAKLILAGVSPRGMMSLTRAARVVAWLAGRTHITPADIHAVAPWTLGHRVFFTPVYELRRTQLATALVEQILERVPTPR
jgi:MoxR-like ATPase